MKVSDAAKMSEDDVTKNATAEDEAPLSDNLLEQFAAYYLMSVLAVRAFEAARAHYAKTELLRAKEPDSITTSR